MSKANNAIKVLRTALHRVQKGWTQNHWSWHNPEDGKTYVCLEGAVYGYCDSNKHQTTPAQREAILVLKQIIFERTGHTDIPSFNDDRKNTTQKDVEEVIKLGMIRLETSDDDLDEYDLHQTNGS